MSNCIEPIVTEGTDRICAVELNQNDNRRIYIITVYMPHQTCVISNFQHELIILEKLIKDLTQKGPVMVIGDMNIHVGSQYGIRGWGVTTQNSHAFMRAIHRCDMNLVDIGYKGSGPTYTYHSTRGSSYIDHCAISNNAQHVISKCEVLDDRIHNVSDHLAIRALLYLQICKPENNDYVRKNFVQRGEGMVFR